MLKSSYAKLNYPIMGRKRCREPTYGIFISLRLRRLQARRPFRADCAKLRRYAYVRF